MEDIIVQYLDKMLAFEEAGYVDEALKLSDKILETFKSDQAEILFEVAKMKFRNGLVKEALLDFIDIYGMTGSNEVYELILEAYYLPNKEEFHQVYCNNMQCLKKYPHYRNSSEITIEIAPIWTDRKIIVFADLIKKKIYIQTRKIKKPEEEKDEILMVVNELWLEDILEFERCYHIGTEFMDMNLPLYLVYDQNYWGSFVQIYNLEELIGKKRIVFLVGEEEAYTYLKEDRVLPPSRFFYNTSQDIYVSMFERLFKEWQDEIKRNSDIVKRYYESNVDNIINRVRIQKPRIVFWTCRFTTALQYHTRDCMQAAMRCGCEAELWIESDGIHRIREIDVLRYLARFKPDIIFFIDYFRFQWQHIPDEVLWVTWIQDDLPYIVNKATPLKLAERDFVMNHFVGWDVIENVGYPTDRLMDAPIVANNYIYKPYKLINTEKKQFGADVCMVCHASDVEECIEDIISVMEGEKIKTAVRQLLYDYCKLVKDTETILYTKEEMYSFIDEYTKKFYYIQLSETLLSYLSTRMFSEFNQRVYRQAIADWLIEAGYQNIKLWGNGWQNIPKYRKYAMGPAQNGEILSKILQSTKIVLGNNIMGTAAARVWESMLSGAFYMSNCVPPETDISDIRKLLREDEDFVMFHNRQDLLNKVEYYLSHEEERNQLAEKGRKVALEKMTYDVLMKRMLVFLSDYFQDK